MTSPHDLEDRLRAVARLRDAPASEAGRVRVRDALRARSPRLVARGAQVAGAWQDVVLVDDLVAAFERLLEAGPKADPGCEAKTAVVDALGRIGEEPTEGRLTDRVFLPGARHAQWEAVWGGRSDTAGALRAACAAGLEAWHHPDVLLVLADHLAEHHAAVRAAAAASLRRRDGADAVPLLRLRLALGDEDPRVLGECARALLALAPSSSLDRVAELLQAEDDGVFSEAALALGESRSAGACDALCAAWRHTFDPERRRLLLTALGTLRREEAVAFLLRRVAEEAPDLACEALAALATHAGDEGVRARLAAAVAENDHEMVTRAFAATGAASDGDRPGDHPRARAE